MRGAGWVDGAGWMAGGGMRACGWQGGGCRLLWVLVIPVGGLAQALFEGDLGVEVKGEAGFFR